jgi:hypothetical protein
VALAVLVLVRPLERVLHGQQEKNVGIQCKAIGDDEGN